MSVFVLENNIFIYPLNIISPSMDQLKLVFLFQCNPLWRDILGPNKYILWCVVSLYCMSIYTRVVSILLTYLYALLRYIGVIYDNIVIV